jgi:hypothetical protein
MLHVEALRLIAREGVVHSREDAAANELEPVFPVVKAVGFVALTEEEPVLTAASQRAPLLQKSAEWSDAGASADHDHAGIWLRRQMKIWRRMDKNADVGSQGYSVRQIAGANARPAVAACFVKHRRNEQVCDRSMLVHT